MSSDTARATRSAGKEQGRPEVSDDGLMEMVEAELERRKTGGTKQ